MERGSIPKVAAQIFGEGFTVTDKDKAWEIVKRHLPSTRKNDFMRASHGIIHRLGVVINYQTYTRQVRLGTVTVPKGATVIHQIVSEDHHAAEVFAEFAQDHGDIYLSVRADNPKAIRFYKRMGFEQVGTIVWSKGTLPGLVFKLKSVHQA